MQTQKIPTVLGAVSVTTEMGGTGPALVFMHGVFLDQTLWAAYRPDLTGRTHVYIDMPAHGQSDNVGRPWQLEECVMVLMQVLDHLQLQRCIVVGHSWGSMVALRAAVQFPQRFLALGLFNMPFRPARGLGRLGFVAQKPMAVFQKFYAQQAAKSLYSPAFLGAHPEASTNMQRRLAARPPKEIMRVIDAVILNAKDTSALTKNLAVPALAVVGKSDYVGTPPGIPTTTAEGGHTSPHEAPQATQKTILEVLALSEQAG